MSIESWSKEFVAEGYDQAALATLRIWIGALPENLEKHQCAVARDLRGAFGVKEKEGKAFVSLTGAQCTPLCKLYWDKQRPSKVYPQGLNHCVLCPLSKSREGVSRCSKVGRETEGPKWVFEDTGNSAPMVEALRKIVPDEQVEAVLGGDWKTALPREE